MEHVLKMCEFSFPFQPYQRDPAESLLECQLSSCNITIKRLFMTVTPISPMQWYYLLSVEWHANSAWEMWSFSLALCTNLGVLAKFHFGWLHWANLNSPWSFRWRHWSLFPALTRLCSVVLLWAVKELLLSIPVMLPFRAGWSDSCT